MVPTRMYTSVGDRFTLPQLDRLSYEQYFRQLSKDGFVGSTTAREFFVKSSLSNEMLAEIWKQADRTKDGRLDVNEFCAAMHMIMTATRQKEPSVRVGLSGSLSKPASTTPTMLQPSNPSRRSSEIPLSQSSASTGTMKWDNSEFSTTIPNTSITRPSSALAGFPPFSGFQEQVSYRVSDPLKPKKPILRSVNVYRDTALRKRQELEKLKEIMESLRRDRRILALESSTLNRKKSELENPMIQARGDIQRTEETIKTALRDEQAKKYVCGQLKESGKNLKQSLERQTQEKSLLTARCSSSLPDPKSEIVSVQSAVAETRFRVTSLEIKLKDYSAKFDTLTKAALRNQLRLVEATRKFSDVKIKQEELCITYGTKQQLVLELSEVRSDSGLATGSSEGSGTVTTFLEYVTAVCSYQGESYNELTFFEGDIIGVLERSDDGWWLGQDTMLRIGHFPASYVQSIPEDSPPNVPAPVRYAVALYDYEAQNADELSFHQDDVIELFSSEETDSDWVSGHVVGDTIRRLIPANYVRFTDGSSGVPVKSNVPAVNPLRQMAVLELIETEERYLTDMNLVIQIFQGALKESGACSNEELQQLFSVWHDLIQCTTTLVKAFNIRRKLAGGQTIETVGDILCEHLPDMLPYVRFCSNQVKMGELIREMTETNPKFAEVLRACSQDQRMKGLPLTAAYVKPMQRITRYPLLIKKILDLTSEDHPDYAILKEALRRTETLCQQVNEAVRVTENNERLDWLQNHVDSFSEGFRFNSSTNFMGSRVLFYQGSLMKVKSGRELVAFLFNDFLLFTTPPRQLASALGNFSFDKRQWTSNLNLRVYRQPLLLNCCKVEQLPDPACFHLTFPNQISFSLKATTVTECRAWIRKIQYASDAYAAMDKQNSQKRNRSIAKSSPVGCCRVIIDTAEDLQPKLPKSRCDAFCKVSLGSQEQWTRVIENSTAPKWDQNMSFIIHDLENEILCLTVLDYDPFVPNGYLGRTELRLIDVFRESNGLNVPKLKRLLLLEVISGEIVLKVDIQMFQ